MMTKKSNVPSVENVSIISGGMSIEGKVRSQGNVRIDGMVKGDIIVSGNLSLGETAEVTGEVRGENITLSGKIFGIVIAGEKLVLESKSYIKGDISAKILVVEPGAKFDGKCSMSGEKKETLKAVANN